MTSMISAVSGYFTRGKLLSTILPALVFVILFLLLVDLPEIEGWLRLERLAKLDPGWRLALATLAVVVVAGLLDALNTPIVRLYEGYPWKNSWLGRRRIARYQRELALSRARSAGLWELRRRLPRAAGPRFGRLGERKWELDRRVLQAFPKEASVLPTRLGNIIRAFESYPWRQYGISAIELWPRLAAVVDEAHTAALDDARSRLDFTLQGSFLSALLAIVLLVTGLADPARRQAWPELLGWALPALLLALLSMGLYRAAIPRAAAWGGWVKGAFDLYRWKLLGSLGYRDAPRTLAEERRLWRQISQQLIYGDPPDGASALRDYADAPRPATAARAAGPAADLRLARGVLPADGEGCLTVVVRVTNRAPRTADNVVVEDRPPEGYAYAWGSAVAGDAAAEVSGAGPHVFGLGEIPAGGAKELVYRVVPVARPAGRDPSSQPTGDSDDG